MATTDIIIIGAGGHAGSVIDVINSTKHYSIKKLVDPKYPMAHGFGVLQDDSKLKDYCKNAGIELGAIGIGSIFDFSAKLRGVELLRSAGLTAPALTASTAFVSPSAHIGWGTVIHHHAVVNAEAHVGEYCTINTSAVVEHDVLIGDYTHIAPGAVVLGGAKIGKYCLIGAGIIVPPGKVIESRSIITVDQQTTTKVNPDL
jgi:sugar O-acyltransferase (sialic acid O-acetyltransferase NeuD family)